MAVATQKDYEIVASRTPEEERAFEKAMRAIGIVGKNGDVTVHLEAAIYLYLRSERPTR